MTARGTGLAAQAAIEFAAVLIALIAMLFGIMYVSYAGYQRSQLATGLTTMADQLPADWESRDPKALAASLILAGSDLDPADLTVIDASVTTDREVSVAKGGVSSEPDLSVRTEERRVTVSAEVSYDYEDAFALGKAGAVRASAERTYITYTDYKAG